MGLTGAERHARVGELFLEAAELQGAARSAFLEQETAGDPDLRREVEGLLASESSTGNDFLTTHASAHLGARREAAKALHLPERIGPFRVLRELGQGGMGVVYEAQQEEPQRSVALKVLRFGLSSAAARRRFAYEVEVLGQLQHPGIARVFAAGTAETPQGEFPYFAMELVRGEPLIQNVERRSLDLRRRLALFNKVCAAVQHAHNRGIVHRDLKPSNILVDAAGEPHVLDFGVARAVDPENRTESRRTVDGQLVGTLPYMSPEQAAGESTAVDTRTDVYSLGVLLFQLLCGQLPLELEDLSVPAAVLAICKEPPQRLSSLRASLAGDLETIAAKALEKDPEQRYASASDLASDVTRFLLDEPIVARPPSLSYTLGKFARRNRALVALSMGFVLALVVALGVTAVALSRALQAEREADLNLAEVERFADQLAAEELIEQAESLYPRSPERVRDYQGWIAKAEDLLARRAEHEAFRQRLETQAAGVPLAPAGPLDDADLRRRWRRSQAAQIVGALDRLEVLREDVQQRLAFASEVRERTLERPAQAWAEAAAYLRGDPRTAHVDLRPQLGLLPLGPDPQSGLYEFWLAGSGERPQRSAETGRWQVEPETGLVLVLLPGGRFPMGAEPPSPDRPLGSPNVDPSATEKERPVHEVELEPFFLSKYELTQGQWRRVHPANPSIYSAARKPSLALPDASDAHPVENLNWDEAERAARRLGLELPTESQWEYAARAGTTGLWWTGDDLHTLQGAENLADRTSLERFREHSDEPSWPFILELSDPWPHHAPVGRMRPSPFGLHDMLGNVSEWVRDPLSEYESAARPGDGLRPGLFGKKSHMRRGGSFRGLLIQSRVAHRMHWARSNRSGHLGLRPSRPLD